MENTIKPFDIVHDETGYHLGDGRKIENTLENYQDTAWRVFDRVKSLVDMARSDISIDDILDLISVVIRDGEKDLDEMEAAQRDLCGHIDVLRANGVQPGGYDDQIIGAEFYDRDDNLIYPPVLSGFHGTSEHLNVPVLLAEAGMSYKVHNYGDATLYILDQCIFDPVASINYSEIVVTKDPPYMSYHCEHKGCRDKTWQDVVAKLHGRPESPGPPDPDNDILDRLFAESGKEVDCNG